MLTFSFPKIQLRGPREKLVTLRAVLGNRVCVAVGLHWWGGVTSRQSAAQYKSQ